MAKELNIITLNVPYPPDYGGMIDSYYRIKWLKDAGIKIHLHCFQYGRPESRDLESLCETVHYYNRQKTLLNLFSNLPYIIKSRSSSELLENLKLNNYPILFDGLHTTYYHKHPDLAGRKKILRAHNIEHLYYKSLAYSEKNPVQKLYFRCESRKLQKYEKSLGSVKLLTISEYDYNYFAHLKKSTILLPPFHQYNEVISTKGSGEYILYHGDLSVRENNQVARSLVKNVFSKLEYNCIIAGKNPPQYLYKTAEKVKNTRIIADPDQCEMEELIRNAHINILPVKSSNGFRLKHLLALYAGRFCIVNSKAAANFHDTSLFHIAESYEEMIEAINQLMKIEFSDEIVAKRKKSLEERFSNKRNALELVNSIFQ